MQVIKDHWHFIWLYNVQIKPGLIKTFLEYALARPSSKQHGNPGLATTFAGNHLKYMAIFVRFFSSSAPLALFLTTLQLWFPNPATLIYSSSKKWIFISSSLCLHIVSPSAQNALPPPPSSSLLLVLQHCGDQVIYHMTVAAFEHKNRH